MWKNVVQNVNLLLMAASASELVHVLFCTLTLDLCLDFFVEKGKLVAVVKCFAVDLHVDFVSEVYLRESAWSDFRYENGELLSWQQSCSRWSRFLLFSALWVISYPEWMLYNCTKDFWFCMIFLPPGCFLCEYPDCIFVCCTLVFLWSYWLHSCFKGCQVEIKLKLAMGHFLCN